MAFFALHLTDCFSVKQLQAVFFVQLVLMIIFINGLNDSYGLCNFQEEYSRLVPKLSIFRKKNKVSIVSILKVL